MFNETLQGFKKFILRGNVIDLAVGIMIGAAFNSVISSLVKDILTPFIAAVIARPDFSKLSFTIHNSQFAYGDFLNNLFSFLITAIAVYFFVVLPINKLNERISANKKGSAAETTVKQCPECLSTIPAKARRCAFCASIQPKK